LQSSCAVTATIFCLDKHDLAIQLRELREDRSTRDKRGGDQNIPGATDKFPGPLLICIGQDFEAERQTSIGGKILHSSPGTGGCLMTDLFRPLCCEIRDSSPDSGNLAGERQTCSAMPSIVSEEERRELGRSITQVP
jgi:hypothetical protein